jgi:hypothetical protein
MNNDFKMFRVGFDSWKICVEFQVIRNLRFSHFIFKVLVNVACESW